MRVPDKGERSEVPETLPDRDPERRRGPATWGRRWPQSTRSLRGANRCDPAPPRPDPPLGAASANPDALAPEPAGFG